MGLFSKEECTFCGEKAGALSREKLQDGEFICKDCKENCSLYFDPADYDKSGVEDHMEYFKKQGVLYNAEFETIPKDEKDEYKYQFSGIVFADSIAMFEIIDPKTKKKSCKELFRYDQIADYERYSEGQGEDGKEYGEVGVEITMRCSHGIAGVGMRDEEKARAHPYLEKVKIPTEKNTDTFSSASRLMNKLNEIFLRESDDKSFAQNIKESFTGTEEDKRNVQQGKDLLKAFGKFAKAAKDGEDLKAAAKAGFQESVIDNPNNALGNQVMHRELADAAEKRAWGE